MLPRLAIISTHPIQYNAPLFQLLTTRGQLQVKVFYTWGETMLNNKFDPGFRQVVKWDIPLLEGYAYEFVDNVATDKGAHHFKGIDNPTLIKQVETFNPDAVLVYGWSYKSHLKVLRYFKGKVPVYFRGDSTLLDETGSIKKWIRRASLRWIYRHVDMAFYVGKSNYAYYKACGLKDRQLVFAPHAIDNGRFAGESEADRLQARQFRERLGISPDAFVFLFAGKLEPKKDPSLLVRVFIKDVLPANTHLVMVGNGILKDQLLQLTTAQPNVHWVDFQNQSQMPAVYAACDVFVLPSAGPGETWGLAINEAMAGSKPVIASDRCGASADLIIQGKNGFVFEAGHVQQLSEYLQWCCTHRADIDNMGYAAKHKVREYSFDRVADAIESTISKRKVHKV